MDFSRLKFYMEHMEEVFHIPGCDLSVYQNHQEVFRYRTGHSDAAGLKPVEEDDLYRLYSCTKVATCVAGLQLVEKGYLKLSDPVGKYLPEYRSLTVMDGDKTVPCQETMLIEDLFTMRGGLDYDEQWEGFQEVIREKGQDISTRDIIEKLAQKPLQFVPRASYQYSLGHDVLAAVIEVITKERFSDYLKENIANPLGMKDFYFHTNPEIQERIAQQYCYVPESGVFEPVIDRNHLLFSHNYDSGGAGLITRVSDYVLLADALANGGVGVTGKQLLKPETIDDMRTNRLDKKQMQAFWRSAKYGYGYGLGVRTLICPSVSEGPVGEFGWDGAAGAYFLSDPQNHIAIFYGQHILNYSDIYTVVHPAIRDMVYRACKRVDTVK